MSSRFPAEPWHRHDRHCYWDHTRCGWVCPPAAIPGPSEDISTADLPDPRPEDPERQPGRRWD